MSDAQLDHARYGRQITLPELGAQGQRALAEVAVRFEPENPLAREAHERAGGLVTDDGEVVVEVPSGGRGVAAWASVEAARRVLGQRPMAVPAGLMERLGG